MQFLRLLRAETSFRPSYATAACRIQSVSAGRPHFHSSSVQQVLNEGDHSKHEDERGDHAEHHKQDQLKKQKEGKGHWKHELASNSESAIKADREELHASEENIAQMQKATADAAQQRRGDEK